MAMLKKIHLRIMILSICFLGLSCQRDNLTPYESGQVGWKKLVTLESLYEIVRFQVIDSHVWLLGSELDASDPMRPQSYQVFIHSAADYKNFEEVKPEGAKSDISYFYFLTPAKGWIITEQSEFLQTNDTGKKWAPVIVDGKTVSASDIYFLDELCGWFHGNSPHMTTDGGETWFPVQSTSSITVGSSTQFINADTAYTLNGSKICRTFDGGDTWECIFKTNSSYGQIIDFATTDGRHMWWINGNVLYFSDDEAQTWQIQVYYVDALRIDFFDEKNGLIVGPSAIWRTSDGGFSWNKINLAPPAEQIYRVRIESENKIWGWSYNEIFQLTF